MKGQRAIPRQQIVAFLLFRILVVALLIKSTEAARNPFSTAAILPGLGNFFGNDEKKDEEGNKLPRGEERKPPPGPMVRPPPPGNFNTQVRQQQKADGRRRPPPPPPPIGMIARGEKRRDVSLQPEPRQPSKVARQDEKEAETTKDAKVLNDVQSTAQTQSEERNQPPPPPPPQYQQPPPEFWGMGPYDPYTSMPPPPPQGWMGPPPEWVQPPNIWQQDKVEENDEERREEAEIMAKICKELDESIARESELLGEVQNLTAAIATFEQREDLHMRQLDVLTERVMDAEAELASERNALLEYESNCTELGRSMALIEDELEEWKELCSNLTAQREAEESRAAELMDLLEERTAELENLASVVEKARLRDERERYIAEKKKKIGFFAWLFGVSRNGKVEEERLKRAQELAKSTLLRALQTERNNVHELEAAVTTLQQNNSAISEMVASRDTLINELNDRVAVFEEDKIVLKAALRQLQKEMSEEAPKTQKLVNDLRDAKEEIQRLKKEMDSLVETHTQEVSWLQETISNKQMAINETESNLTIIGTYVDKLEERLASFAIARRDIQIREQKCEKIEERDRAMEKERDELKDEISRFSLEHDDLKKLLEDLVSERASLYEQKAKLSKERDGLLHEGSTLRDTIASLEQDLNSLDQIVEEWQSKAKEFETTIEGQTTQLNDYETKERERLEKEAREQNEREQEALRQAAVEQAAKEQAAREAAAKEQAALEAAAKEKEAQEQESKNANENRIPSGGVPSPGELGSPQTTAGNPQQASGHESKNATKANASMPPFLKAPEGKSPMERGGFPARGRQTGPQPRPFPMSQAQKRGAPYPPHVRRGRRNVPLRYVRKAFARATGVHGFFSKKPKSIARGAIPRRTTAAPPPYKGRQPPPAQQQQQQAPPSKA